MGELASSMPTRYLRLRVLSHSLVVDFIGGLTVWPVPVFDAACVS